MDIVFVLPRPTARIVGGFKVVYDYSNYLCSIGNNVTIAYDCEEIGTRISLENHIIKKAYGRILRRISKWPVLDHKIKELFISKPEDLDNIRCDAIIATAVNTADMVFDAKSVPTKRKIYLIQDFENWNRPEEFVYRTYKLPITKIVVSKWLYDLVKSQYDNNRNIYLCPNGIDLDKYKITKDIECRNNKTICFLYHTDNRKGLKTLIPVIEKLHNKYEDLIFRSFGAFEHPQDLPDYVEYYPFASTDTVCKLYNSSAIFVCSSYEEGYGLTGAESMACGCALVTTNTNGSREYATDKNAAICNPNNEEELFAAIEQLVNCNEKRICIANQGFNDMKNHSIEVTNYNFYKTLLTICE